MDKVICGSHRMAQMLIGDASGHVILLLVVTHPVPVLDFLSKDLCRLHIREHNLAPAFTLLLGRAAKGAGKTHLFVKSDETDVINQCNCDITARQLDAVMDVTTKTCCLNGNNDTRLLLSILYNSIQR